ncbi:MAG: hypothetical protein FWD34_10440 [Oscillospiraceae bacterium]|nr:hypothetical protein [Oscillospiraceae bacterium]
MKKAIIIIAMALAVVLATGIIVYLVTDKSLAGQYVLDNPGDNDNFTFGAMSVTLNNDGTAWIAQPAISSYMLGLQYYTVTDNELLIHSEIGNPIARFDIDGNTLVFRSSTIHLYIDEGARYVKQS